MKKIAVGAAIAAVLLLAGCSSTPSREDACATLDKQGVEMLTAMKKISPTDADGSKAALDDAEAILDDMQKTEGPEEFIQLREKLVKAVSAFLAESRASIEEQQDLSSMDSRLRVSNATNEIVAYCN